MWVPLIINDTQLIFDENKYKGIIEWLFQELKKRLNQVEEQDTEIVLVFLDKSQAKELNLKFRGKDYATDVLSFESTEENSLGELVFCSDVLIEQSTSHNQSMEDELIYLTLHGILHLLGFEHENGGVKEVEMMSLQDEIWQLYINECSI